MNLEKRFNERQKQALQHTEGPLLVISGAGTGKTHLLTGKIRYLILEKHVPADQILALTFTEKAAEEMAQRVDEALPLGHPAVAIKTFHGFADTVLRERGHEIGLSVEYTILQSADLWMFLKRHLGEFHFEHYRPFSAPDRFLRMFHDYVSRLQDEDITPQQYIDFSQASLAKATDDAEREHGEKHLELARAYQIYNDLRKKHSIMDFGGLLFFTLRLFETRPSVLREYGERFRYVLVDEFQDTNFAQNKIVTAVASRHQNITVVGDDDQSIYKWRGASLTNMQYFQKVFPKASLVVLNENYRSGQMILDMAYSVIQKNNPGRLESTAGVDKHLYAASPHKETTPQVHHFSSSDDELSFIVTKAKDSLKKGHDTAILVRTNALALTYAEQCELEKIPYQHFSPTKIFQKEGVRDCVAVLRVVANPSDDLALYRLLSRHVWNIPMEALLKALKDARYNSVSLFESLRERVFEPALKSLKKLIEDSRTSPVSAVVGKFLEETQYLKQAEPEAIEDIGKFSEKVAAFEATHPERQVVDFLHFLELLESTGESSQNEAFLDPGVVKILTIHTAKGLEFDRVFLPGLVSGKFPAIRRRDPLEIPAELIPEPLPTGDHHLEEERRLFYVGVTRAKELLTLSYSDFYDGKKQWKVSPFVLEALESGKVASKGEIKGRKKSAAKSTQTSLLTNARDHRTLKLDLPRLSYSQLDTFSTCPLKYQFRYLLNIPTPLPAAVTFGTSIHNTLRAFYDDSEQPTLFQTEKGLPLLYKLYKKHWIPGGYESRLAHDQQKKLGEEMLAHWYEAEKTAPGKPKFLEKAFTLSLGEVTVAGRIDRIDILPNGTYEIVDYKTGRSREKDLSKDLQLSLYALAAKEVFHIPVSKLSLYYLDPLEKISTTRNDTDLEACKQEVLACAHELAASDFAPKPGFHCQWCDFRFICEAGARVVG